MLINSEWYGEEKPCLVDTGAIVSVMSEAWYQKLLQKRPSLRRSLRPEEGGSIRLADGRTIPCVGRVSLHFKIGPFSWNFHFKVVRHLCYDVILGLDFMSRVGMKIDVSGQCVEFGFAPETRVPLLGNVEGAQVFVAGELDKQNQMECLLRKYSDVVTSKIGKCKIAPYKFTLMDETPIRSRPFPCSPPKMKIFRDLIESLERAGVIRPSNSDFSAPAFLVNKAGSSGFRLVVNHAKLNQRINLDPFPLPTVESALQHLGRAKFFSVLDLNSSFFQVELQEECRRFTAFSTPWKQYEFLRVPMGANFGSQALSRVLDEVLAEFKYQFVFNYVDDVIVYSESWEQHVKDVEKVLLKLREAGLTVNPKKINMGKQAIKFLGYIVSDGHLSMDPEKVRPIVEYPAPKNVRAVQRFMGMIGYYARFIPNLTETASPLNELKRKGVVFEWTAERDKSFHCLKRALCNSPVLRLPDFTRRFSLHVDASSKALGAVLQQVDLTEEGHPLAPLAYASRTLTAGERKLSAYEKEALACLFGMEKFQCYLDCTEFDLYTDNQALSWILGHPNQLGKIGRWVLRLSRFRYKVHHVSGKLNVVADALSRMFDEGGEQSDVSGDSVQDQLNESDVAFVYAFPDLFIALKEHQERDEECERLKTQLRQDPGLPYVLEGGTLLRKGGPRKRKRTVVPKNVRPMILRYFHDSPFGCHQGAERTLKKISRDLYWPGMQRDVRAYVKACQDCQRYKPAQNARVGFHSAQVVTRSWERVHVDVFGPLVRSRKGNVALLVLVDCFSKFVVLLPIRDLKSKTLVRALTDSVWRLLGPPCELVSDNASCFISGEFQDMCFEWGVRHFTSSPYYPKGNIVERVNKNLKSCLAIFCREDHTSWDEHLNWINMGLNASFHGAVGEAPSVPFLGRDLLHPLLNIWGIPNLESPLSPQERQVLCRRINERLLEAQRVVASRFDAGRIPTPYKVGDQVWCKAFHLSDLAHKVSAKLSPRYAGPFEVVKFLGPVTVLLSLVSDKAIIRKAHVSHLKMFNRN